MLASSATLLAGAAAVLTGCSGPNPLAGPPPVSPEVHEVFGAIAAEEALINTYNRAIARYSGLSATLAPLLADHRAHLARLRARIVEPPGHHLAVRASRAVTVPGSRAATMTMLAGAERSAASACLRRLGAVPASTAQLLASIAACEVTHAQSLTGQVPS